MKKVLCLLLLALAVPGFAPGQTNAAHDGSVTYILPLHGQIEEALVYAIRRGANEAKALHAKRVIIDMDTPGGRLDCTETIIGLIESIGATTYTFVNPDAISAGAITALSTDHIYMSPSGRIGDAIPLMVSPFGTPQALPNELKEKAVSPTEALIRSVAQRHGHDPELAAKMVRVEREYKIGDIMISPTGQVLTLTSVDAAQLVGPDKHRLLSAGTVDSIDALITDIGADPAHVVHFESSVAEELARWIRSFPISGILLGLGLLAIYIEIKTPGFGVPGISGGVLIAIWFFGHHVAGLAGMEEAVLFIIGLILILVEIFLIPGFGMIGVAGIGCMVAGAAMGMVEHVPGSAWYSVPAPDFNYVIINFSASLITLIGGAILLAKILPKTTLYGRLINNTNQVGYSAAGSAVLPSVGARGVASTKLRPAGIATFDGQRIDVVAQGDFIDSGSAIVIVATKGNRIVVTKDSAAS